jgi:hypothetical protein
MAQNAENPVTQIPKSAIKGQSGYLADVTTANELKVALSGSIVIPTQTVSEGPTGAPVPADATLIGGKGPTGNLTSVSVDASGNLNAVVSGAVTVTGSVTANAGTNLNTSALALDATLTNATQKTKIVDTGGTNVATVSAAGAVKVDGSAVTQPVSVAGSATSTAPAATAVSNVSGSILTLNASRKQAIVINVGTTVVFIALGQTPTTSAYHVALAPCTSANDGTGGTFITDVWTGAINAICAVSGTVCVTELT